MIETPSATLARADLHCHSIASKWKYFAHLANDPAVRILVYPGVGGAVQRLGGREAEHADMLGMAELGAKGQRALGGMPIKKKGRGGWPEAAIALALADYAQQEIDLHRGDVQAQHQLAMRYRLSAYDVAYLWLAAELKAPLATFDEKLAKAARTHLATLS